MLAALSTQRILFSLILGFNTVTFTWFTNYLTNAGAACDGLAATQYRVCETTTAMSLALSVGSLIFFVIVGNMALGALWKVSVKHICRPCPVCGTRVEEKRAICHRCGSNVHRSPLQQVSPMLANGHLST